MFAIETEHKVVSRYRQQFLFPHWRNIPNSYNAIFASGCKMCAAPFKRRRRRLQTIRASSYPANSAICSKQRKQSITRLSVKYLRNASTTSYEQILAIHTVTNGVHRSITTKGK